jgi:hypothetical protein
MAAGGRHGIDGICLVHFSIRREALHGAMQ